MNMYSDKAEFAFQSVLEEAQWDGWRNSLLRRPSKLLSFTAIKNMLKLGLPQDRGVQEIEIDDIVGSVGRYNEFNRSFKPTQSYTRSRWKTVAEAYFQKGFDPIRVYKVSDIYFVINGNHRVSVSRAMNLQTISAHVFEFDMALELDNKDDLDDICRKWHSYQIATGQITNSGPVRMQKSRETSRGALLTFMLGVVLIGTVPIFVRFSEVGPMATGFWRVFLSLPFLLFWLNRRDQLSEGRQALTEKKWLFWMVLAGFGFAGDQAAFNLAVQKTTVANATLLLNMSPISGWLPLLALALISHICGQGLITFSAAKISASTASIGLLTQPVAAAIMAAVVLLEPMSMEQIIGGLVILAGISVTQAGDDLKQRFQTSLLAVRRQLVFA